MKAIAKLISKYFVIFRNYNMIYNFGKQNDTMTMTNDKN